MHLADTDSKQFSRVHGSRIDLETVGEDASGAMEVTLATRTVLSRVDCRLSLKIYGHCCCSSEIAKA
jgi:hypothetical protein